MAHCTTGQEKLHYVPEEGELDMDVEALASLAQFIGARGWAVQHLKATQRSRPANPQLGLPGQCCTQA